MPLATGQGGAAAELRAEFTAMACPCVLHLLGGSDGQLEQAAHAAVDEVRRIEARYSRYRPDSVLSAINARAGGDDEIEVDAETAALLDFAAQLHDASAGRFDATAGVLRRAWDFRSARLPARAEVEALLPLVGWHRLHWTGRTLRLPLPGMELDFGGLGKEYAADRCATLLAGAGVHQGFVDLGGDIRVLGPGMGGRPWRFGIRHPREPGALAAEVELAHGALATSGDYERFIEHDGRRHSHLLDARIGWPPPGQWRSVSVVAPNCSAAGAVASLAMLMGDDAAAFLASQGVSWFAHDALGRPCGPLLASAAVA